jgi:uncharacterized repeat protein (TIGR04138 family)
MEIFSKIERLTQRDPRYRANAYTFVLEAVEFVISALPETRHISGRELCDGIRKLGLQKYGPMAKEVFNYWGIQKTEDFGNIVFNLTNEGLLSATDEDSIDDFIDIYDFAHVFEEDYYGR